MDPCLRNITSNSTEKLEYSSNRVLHNPVTMSFLYNAKAPEMTSTVLMSPSRPKQQMPHFLGINLPFFGKKQNRCIHGY